MIRLRELRLQHGIKAARLAAYVGVSRQTIHMWEAGRFPKTEHLEKAAEFFRRRRLLGAGAPATSLLEEVPADAGMEGHADLIDKRAPKKRAADKTEC